MSEGTVKPGQMVEIHTNLIMPPIPVPVAAARRIDAIIQRRGALEQELAAAVALVLATLGAPDGWQLRIEPDGSMVAVAPQTPAAE